MRIFIDIGAHYGETARIALAHDFDRVHSLEPSAHAYRSLRKIRDIRFSPERLALSDRDGEATLYGAGELGGSVYAEKKQLTDKLETETIYLMKASAWFQQLQDAETFVKMNCEGSEVDILSDLLDTGVIDRIDHLFVDFDIRKVAGQEHRQEQIEDRLKQCGVRYVTTESCTFETWLDSFGIPRRHRKQIELYEMLVSGLRVILPKRLYLLLAERFGRIARQSA